MRNPSGSPEERFDRLRAQAGPGPGLRQARAMGDGSRGGARTGPGRHRRGVGRGVVRPRIKALGRRAPDRRAWTRLGGTGELGIQKAPRKPERRAAGRRRAAP